MCDGILMRRLENERVGGNGIGTIRGRSVLSTGQRCGSSVETRETVATISKISRFLIRSACSPRLNIIENLWRIIGRNQC